MIRTNHLEVIGEVMEYVDVVIVRCYLGAQGFPGPSEMDCTTTGGGSFSPARLESMHITPEIPA